MKKNKIHGQLQEIAKNLDYSLRVNGHKSVAVVSDRPREGKSAFIAHCLPVLCELYEKKVLIFDLQNERDDYLERKLTPVSVNKRNVRKTIVKGLDYVHVSDLVSSDAMSDSEMSRMINTKYGEISAEYDVVFINTKTSGVPSLPVVPLDGAVLVRSRKSLGKKKQEVTVELMDRNIPILGIVMNEGV